MPLGAKTWRHLTAGYLSYLACRVTELHMCDSSSYSGIKRFWDHAVLLCVFYSLRFPEHPVNTGCLERKGRNREHRDLGSERMKLGWSVKVGRWFRDLWTAGHSRKPIMPVWSLLF